MRGLAFCMLAACTYTPPADVAEDASNPDTPVDSPPDAPPDAPPDTQPAVYVGFSDATTNGTPGFYIFKVYGTSADTDAFPGTFTAFAGRIAVNAIRITCDPSGPTELGAFATLGVTLVGVGPMQKYQMAKNVTQIGTGLVTGECYRFQPTLDGDPLGFTDLQVTSGTPPAPFHRATPSSNLTIKFRTEDSLD